MTLEKSKLFSCLWLVVTVSSVLGSLIGYLIGQRWGRSLITKFGSPSHVQKIEALTQRYGTLGIFIAAFSPIPYKVFGWLAGMGEMDKRPFIAAGLLGRGLRFGLEAILIGVYGNQAFEVLMWFLDNEILLAVVILLAELLLSGRVELVERVANGSHRTVLRIRLEHGNPRQGMRANHYEGVVGGRLSLVWCSQVHHSGFSSRRPGFESRPEHLPYNMRTA